MTASIAFHVIADLLVAAISLACLILLRILGMDLYRDRREIRGNRAADRRSRRGRHDAKTPDTAPLAAAAERKREADPFDTRTWRWYQ